jgi:hypothetical protein
MIIGIKSPRGVTVTIGYYPDTPNKNYRIYYCGSDTGERYEYPGNASRRLQRYAHDWTHHGITDITLISGSVSDIPRR